MTEVNKKLTAWFNPASGEFITPLGILAWPQVLTAKATKGDASGRLRFTANLLLPKVANIELLLEEQEKALIGRFGVKARTNKKLRRAVVPTTDEPAFEPYVEKFPYYVKAANNAPRRPQVYDGKEEFIGDADQIYSGRAAIIGGTFYAYEQGGVKFGLDRVILGAHGEPLDIKGGTVRDTLAGFESVNLADDETADDMWR